MSIELENFERFFSRPEQYQINDFVNGKVDFYDLSDDLIYKLYDFFRDEMPVGIMKAREGDPDVWLQDRLAQIVGGAPVFDEAAAAKKTEHSGPKKGDGAYWGRKKDAKRESNKKRRKDDKKAAKMNEAFELNSEAVLEDAFEDAPKIPVKIGYGAYNVFQRYWHGQGDPLYAVLSRRGNSVDWETVEATQEEADRLMDVAWDIVHGEAGDESEQRVANHFVDNNQHLIGGEMEESVDPHDTGAVIEYAMDESHLGMSTRKF